MGSKRIKILEEPYNRVKEMKPIVIAFRESHLLSWVLPQTWGVHPYAQPVDNVVHNFFIPVVFNITFE